MPNESQIIRMVAKDLISATKANKDGRRRSLTTIPRDAVILVEAAMFTRRQIAEFTWEGVTYRAFSNDIRRRAASAPSQREAHN